MWEAGPQGGVEDGLWIMYAPMQRHSNSSLKKCTPDSQLQHSWLPVHEPGPRTRCSPGSFPLPSLNSKERITASNAKVLLHSRHRSRHFICTKSFNLINHLRCGDTHSTHFPDRKLQNREMNCPRLHRKEVEKLGQEPR